MAHQCKMIQGICPAFYVPPGKLEKARVVCIRPKRLNNSNEASVPQSALFQQSSLKLARLARHIHAISLETSYSATGIRYKNIFPTPLVCVRRSSSQSSDMTDFIQRLAGVSRSLLTVWGGSFSFLLRETAGFGN